MEVTVGNDIIEVNRIKETIENLNEKFLNRIYTNNEIEYCEKKKLTKYQHYAARFAGKEAVFKAISNLLENKFDIEWKDIEIINDENGKPFVNLLNSKLTNIKIDISLSHINEYAIATAVVVKTA